MDNNITGNSQKKIARIAGLLYTLMIPLGAFGIMYIPSAIVVSGNIGETVSNVIANAVLFRLSLLSAIIVQISHIFIVLLLYKLLKFVNKNMATLMVVFMLISIPIATINELNHFVILFLSNNSTLLQKNDFITLFFRLHEYGILLAGVFWGLWLFPMGYLVLKSSFLPKAIGIILMIACFGYVIDSMLKLALPGYTETIFAQLLIITLYGEILFPLWLLMRGINIQKWEEKYTKIQN